MTNPFEEQILPQLHIEKGEHFLRLTIFLKPQSGTLPSFSWVTSAGRHNEHPQKNIQAGQHFVAQIIGAVMKSPNWHRTVLFFTYDEHGGFYDHVPPPRACPPENIPPMLEAKDVPENSSSWGAGTDDRHLTVCQKTLCLAHSIRPHLHFTFFVQARFNLPALLPEMPMPNHPLICLISNILHSQSHLNCQTQMWTRAFSTSVKEIFTNALQ